MEPPIEVTTSDLQPALTKLLESSMGVLQH